MNCVQPSVLNAVTASGGCRDCAALYGNVSLVGMCCRVRAVQTSVTLL